MSISINIADLRLVKKINLKIDSLKIIELTIKTKKKDLKNRGKQAGWLKFWKIYLNLHLFVIGASLSLSSISLIEFIIDYEVKAQLIKSCWLLKVL